MELKKAPGPAFYNLQNRVRYFHLILWLNYF